MPDKFRGIGYSGMKLRDLRSLTQSLRGFNTKDCFRGASCLFSEQTKPSPLCHFWEYRRWKIYVARGDDVHGAAGVGVDQDLRGLVFDAKRDLIPFLEALGVPYKILNPLDQRCVAWDIGHDNRGEGMAVEFAALLVEDLRGGKPKGDNQYFYDAAKWQLRLRPSVCNKQRAMGLTLRDLINVFETKESFTHFLHTYHPRPHHFDEFLKARRPIAMKCSRR